MTTMMHAPNASTQGPANQNPLTLWGDIKSWLHAPFVRPLDPINWILLLLFSATVAYAWSRVLDKVLEE